MVDDNKKNKKKQKRVVVAVIGGGVTGMSAAWHLATCTNTTTSSHHHHEYEYEVHLFESNRKLGGHAYTTTINLDDNDQNNGNNSNNKIDVDVGFMVYNNHNYPNMIEWFKHLGVESESSDMSLSVSLDKGAIEWNSDGLNGIFANRSQLFSADMYRCIYDMVRFNSESATILSLHDDDPRKHVTTAQYLEQNNYSDAFGRMYLLPMMAALWSASIDDVRQFPAAQLIGFLCNHKMLQLFQRPEWKTPANRSRTYVKQVQRVLLESENNNATVHLNTPVYAVEKKSNGKYNIIVLNKESDDTKQIILADVDGVIFACHPPIAKTILENGSNGGIKNKSLLNLLDSIKYADNVVYVHSDPTCMPVRRRAWSSWNCMGRSQHLSSMSSSSASMSTEQRHDKKYRKLASFEGGASGFGATATATTTASSSTKQLTKRSSSSAGSEKKHVHFDTSSEGDGYHHESRMKAVYVTYWLNRLQNLQTDHDIFVSLNPHTPPPPSLTYEKLIMAHPQFTPTTLLARRKLLSSPSNSDDGGGGFQGRDGLWFAGAWAGYGFHEDGCRSGFDVATKLSGEPLPWVKEEEEGANKSLKSAAAAAATDKQLLVLPPPDLSKIKIQPSGFVGRLWNYVTHKLTYDLPVAICKRFILYFLNDAVKKGCLRLKLMNDYNSIYSFGDGTPCGCGDSEPVTLQIFDDWFFVKTALEYDLGMARSYMAGYFNVEPLDNVSKYHPVLRPAGSDDETTIALGDPIGLTRLLLLLIGNRDHKADSHHTPKKSGQGHWYSNAFTTASGLVISKIGVVLNYLRFKLTMDNSEKGGSLKNIHAHYDLSNDVFTSFLDSATMMYSCAIYDAIKAPSTLSSGGLVFRGTLEEAQQRKVDTLLARAQIQPNMTVLDIGFGWGGLCIAAAQKYGCKVTGITLSVEQKALAEERVKAAGVEHLIEFEVIDYRTFARQARNRGKFDRVLSCEMIEAVGHDHLGEFFWAVEQVLKHDGVLVMEAITTPEERYENYVRTTDFINTIIFPGSCCPSLHALVDAAYKQSSLTLEHIDNIGLHYAQTLAEWRRRFNANREFIQSLGFDDVFLRAWNYYLTYCEAGFFSQTENCLILVFSRQGCRALAPLSESRSVTQATPFTDAQIQNWVEGKEVPLIPGVVSF